MSRPQPRRPTPTPEHRPAVPGRPPLELHRSPRRRRSGQAAFRDGRIVVRLPADLPDDEVEHMVTQLVDKVLGRQRAAAAGGDAALRRRAAELADRYLDGVRATSVTWSPRMRALHGSCTPGQGTIRISQRLAAHPRFVLDYVLVHELAHLLERGHGPAFHALVSRFPQADRARGYLEGYAAGERAAATPQHPDEPIDAAAG